MGFIFKLVEKRYFALNNTTLIPKPKPFYLTQFNLPFNFNPHLDVSKSTFQEI